MVAAVSGMGVSTDTEAEPHSHINVTGRASWQFNCQEQRHRSRPCSSHLGIILPPSVIELQVIPQSDQFAAMSTTHLCCHVTLHAVETQDLVASEHEASQAKIHHLKDSHLSTNSLLKHMMSQIRGSKHARKRGLAMKPAAS